ncbi:hypothetical protein ElyMa_005854000 [Elysia marginata]|uniref:Uncharacterized protein n=1 Tax=Elysia marginata TaxID=1093978 RepID=A0AAV4FZ38_9GAST|nr:hypothetical protein ElyMa_005854000 [Elysia marginata]
MYRNITEAQISCSPGGQGKESNPCHILTHLVADRQTTWPQAQQLAHKITCTTLQTKRGFVSELYPPECPQLLKHFSKLVVTSRGIF